MLDAVILGNLFDRKYMDFETCCNLRLVSRKFYFHAGKYFKSLTKLDLSVLPENSGKKSDHDNPAYSRLFKTVTKYCVNLRQLKNVDHRFCEDSFARLGKLTNLTRVEFRNYFYACPDTFAILKQLPNLRSVVFDELQGEWDGDELPESGSDDDSMHTEATEESSKTDDDIMDTEASEESSETDDDIMDTEASEESSETDDETPQLQLPENEKMHVEELSLVWGKFWHIFCLACLKKLTISWSFFELEFRVEQFNSLLPLCQNLESLEVSFSADWAATLFPPLARITESLPRFEKFTVNLDGSRKQVDELISKCPQIIKHVTKLESLDLVPKGNFAQFRPNRNISMPNNFRC